MKLLIIDDEKNILWGLNNLLTKFGYACTTQDDALKAIEFFDKDQYDVVITDLKMPNKDGFQILRDIHKKNYNTKLILMTGYHNYDYEKTAQELGVYAYLHKPLNLEKLLQILQSIKDQR